MSQVNANFLRRDGTNSVIGALNMNSNTINNLGSPNKENDAATKAYVDNHIGVSKSGDTMSGELKMSDNKITGLHAPTDKGDAANKQYVDTQNRKQVSKAGDVMTGDLKLSSTSTDLNRILGCVDLTAGKKFILALGTLKNNIRFGLAFKPQEHKVISYLLQ